MNSIESLKAAAQTVIRAYSVVFTQAKPCYIETGAAMDLLRDALEAAQGMNPLEAGLTGVPLSDEQVYTPSQRRKPYDQITGEDFRLWCNSIDGKEYAARVLGVSVRSIERYYTGALKLPRTLKVVMRLADENLMLKIENAQLKRDARGVGYNQVS